MLRSLWYNRRYNQRGFLLTLMFGTHENSSAVCFPNFPLARTKRSRSSWPVHSLVVQIKYSWRHWSSSLCWGNATGVTGDDKVHLCEVGIGVKSENRPPVLLQRSRWSVSQEGSPCQKKSVKSTSNYPGNWQWNWKKLGAAEAAHPPPSPHGDSCHTQDSSCVTRTSNCQPTHTPVGRNMSVLH